MDNQLVLSSAGAARYGEDLLGGKAHNLAWLTRNGLPVPEWFVLTTQTFHAQLKQQSMNQWITEQLEGLEKKDPAAFQTISQAICKRIEELSLHPDIEKALDDQLSTIEGWEETFFAVRSSAVGEDAAQASFAGQLDSCLFQKGIDNIRRSVLNCFAGAFSVRALKYRLKHGMNLDDIQAAVIVQRMIEGQVSGVFFTAHPVTGSLKKGLISACYGLGEGVVSGVCNTDEFTVELYGSEVEATINDKDRQMIYDAHKGAGTKETAVPADLRERNCLRADQIRRIKELGCIISEGRHCPQDIEWTICNDQIHILQTRPITSLPAPLIPEGREILWDNSNIQESYCGVTTPLTFSFASNAYKNVFKQTYQLLGVPKKTMKELENVFPNLLGIIKGRVYYNISIGYRILLILPGLKKNKADQERMLGLEYPVDFIKEERMGLFQKMVRLPGLLRALWGLVFRFWQMDRLVSQFRDMFQHEYDHIDRKRLHTLEIAELMALVADLKERIMGNWQTPIINDFYVMMTNGRVFRKLQKAEIEDPTALMNHLMSGEQGIESTEPTKFILRLCEEIRSKQNLTTLLKETQNKFLLEAIQSVDKDFYQKCIEYIELYGDRCIGELKLESISLRQDASFLFAILKNYLAREDLAVDTLASSEMNLRKEAEDRAFTAISRRYGPRKLIKFKALLTKWRQAVKNRENMRLMRTRAFGLARDLYLEIGKRLAFYDLLLDHRDIFYLTEDELEQYMDGRSIQTMFKPLVAARKAEYKEYEEQELPYHFYTKGPIYHHNRYEFKGTQAINETAAVLTGIGCYPGEVEKPVKIIFSADDELDLNGKILCTLRTDPGWAPLFPTTSGILVERGSSLSHSAVVARELGIPAIVNIPGLTKLLKDGETVCMDGNKGTVTRTGMQPLADR